jgi:hypothetical protein
MDDVDELRITTNSLKSKLKQKSKEIKAECKRIKEDLHKYDEYVTNELKSWNQEKKQILLERK